MCGYGKAPSITHPTESPVGLPGSERVSHRGFRFLFAISVTIVAQKRFKAGYHCTVTLTVRFSPSTGVLRTCN